MKKYLIKTYGCQMNVHESEKLAGLMEGLGYTAAVDENECAVIIFNSCCIRHSAENKFFGHLSMLKSLKERNPDIITAVCGCLPQRPGGVDKVQKQNPYVDIIFGTHNLHCLQDYILRFESERKKVVDIWDEGGIEEDLPVKREEDGSAWVNIMYGCDNYCAYCIVPFVRGRERSREFDTIINEVKGLIADGVKDMTLLGQNVNSYASGGKDFADLIGAVAALDGDFTVKFLTSHPKDFSQKLVDTIAANPKIARHIHLPVQAGSDRILQLMNRKYTAARYLDTVAAIRRAIPDCVLSTDVIVGFPTETEEEYNATLDLLQKVRFNKLFAFMFSRRTGTAADTMDGQIDISVKRERIKKLLDLQKEIERNLI